MLLKVTLAKVKVNFIFSMIHEYSNKKHGESGVRYDTSSSETFDRDDWEKFYNFTHDELEIEY